MSDVIRRSGCWMEYADDRILEHLADVSKASAWEIALEAGMRNKRRWIERRCWVLVEAGFVDVYERGELDNHYEITTWGELYLEGEVDAELQRPVPATRPPDKVRPGWWAGFG